MLAPALHILKRNKLRLTIFCICKDVCMTRNIKLKLKVAFLVPARVKGITSQLNLKPWLGFLWGGEWQPELIFLKFFKINIVHGPI